MKKEMTPTAHTFIRRTIFASIITCVMAVSFVSNTATAQKQNFYVSKTNPLIKYLGTIQDKLLFQIDLKMDSDDKMFVSIRDEDGNTLFKEKVADKSFTKKFAFEKEELEGKTLTFIIHTTKGDEYQSFQVSRNTRLVEDVVITKQ